MYPLSLWWVQQPLGKPGFRETAVWFSVAWSLESAYGGWGWFSGIVFPPFVKLCTVQGALSPRMSWQTLRLKRPWCIPKPLSGWGQALWQVLFAVRFSRADSEALLNGPARGWCWWMMQTQAWGAMPKQTGVMSALATDGRAPFPVLRGLLRHLELVNEEQ